MDMCRKLLLKSRRTAGKEARKETQILAVVEVGIGT